jgi:hypothetical protein
MHRFLFLIFLLAATKPVSADPNNIIPAFKSIDVKVGQSVVVRGYRGECGKRPVNVDPNRTRDTKLGVLSNGKWGVTKSDRCGGLTPAIEIIFSAKKAGRETVKIAGERVKIKVR